jgi:hypothetical protein
MLLRLATQIDANPIAHRPPDSRDALRARLSRLRAVVLLAGSVVANELRKATGRSSLEMPVGNNRTVMDCWREQLVALAETVGLERLPVRVMIDRTARLPRHRNDHGPVTVSIEEDPTDLRGTGGLLCDLCQDYADDDLVLVTPASQILFESLTNQLLAMAELDADVTMVASADGAPAGLQLMRCGALRDIKRVGFVDFFEQALPKILERHDVRVVRYDQLTSRSLRTMDAYLSALQEYHQQASGRLAPEMPFREQWQPSFSIVEPGAAVHGTAVIHDSVVLAGARVDRDAVLVRSVVCPGASVEAGESHIDSLVCGRTPTLLGR